ncbi:unnamed protein product, partial [Brachionus calyciflorus]
PYCEFQFILKDYEEDAILSQMDLSQYRNHEKLIPNRIVYEDEIRDNSQNKMYGHAKSSLITNEDDSMISCFGNSNVLHSAFSVPNDQESTDVKIETKNKEKKRKSESKSTVKKSKKKLF